MTTMTLKVGDIVYIPNETGRRWRVIEQRADGYLQVQNVDSGSIDPSWFTAKQIFGLDYRLELGCALENDGGDA